MNFLKDVADYMTPILTTSQFLQKGVLTPEEFVEAGDELVYRCPSWSWASGDQKCSKKYFPKDKQYLVTRNVPSLRRSSDYEMEAAAEQLLEQSNDDADGWIATHTNRVETDIVDVIDIRDRSESSGHGLAEFEQEIDECGIDAEVFVESVNESVIRTRTYDLTITYDKFYQTPRIWLFGYDENHSPLSTKEIMEEISSDHANRTVTVEAHPHLYGVSVASIHPCRHASVIKTIIDRLIETGSQPNVRSYMFWFLKLISAVVPTINYDFTVDVHK